MENRKRIARSVEKALKSDRKYDASGHKLFTDDTIYPYGKKYNGLPMRDIPDDYLLWMLGCLRDEALIPKSRKAMLYEYLKDNEDAMIANVNRAKAKEQKV